MNLIFNQIWPVRRSANLNFYYIIGNRGVQKGVVRGFIHQSVKIQRSSLTLCSKGGVRVKRSPSSNLTGVLKKLPTQRRFWDFSVSGCWDIQVGVFIPLTLNIYRSLLLSVIHGGLTHTFYTFRSIEFRIFGSHFPMQNPLSGTFKNAIIYVSFD